MSTRDEIDPEPSSTSSVSSSSTKPIYHMDLSPTILSPSIITHHPSSSDSIVNSKFQPKAILRQKVILIGDDAVGKTSILKWITSNGSYDYPKQYIFTSEVDLYIHEIHNVPESPHDTSTSTSVIVDLFLLDMAGQSIFHQRDLASRYWNHSKFVICVFDVSRRKSLHSCANWIQSVRAGNATNDNSSNSSSSSGSSLDDDRDEMIGLLVGNKIDLREGGMDARAEVDTKEAMEFATEHNLEYFECSASMGLHLDEPFQFIASKVRDKFHKSFQGS